MLHKVIAQQLNNIPSKISFRIKFNLRRFDEINKFKVKGKKGQKRLFVGAKTSNLIEKIRSSFYKERTKSKTKKFNIVDGSMIIKPFYQKTLFPILVFTLTVINFSAKTLVFSPHAGCFLLKIYIDHEVQVGEIHNLLLPFGCERWERRSEKSKKYV
jgi:hypothetical protein